MKNWETNRVGDSLAKTLWRNNNSCLILYPTVLLQVQKMKEIRIRKYIRYLFGIAVLVFILNKVYLRPWILENKLSGNFLIVTNSIPNLIEAIIGTLILTGILLQIRLYFNKKFGAIKDTYIHILAVSIASIYVISQELKFHNFGGNNIYDPYDIAASLIGLTVTFGIIQLFGFTEIEAGMES